ncbi:hypothetical protein T01_5819 [Trichinella spiralis]|uniref:Uncharacterized protein n=1 Tax=Trichinella spiralis TaxID=6334 RepID=A0A0V1B5H6_TRISP|nr:hypothetical protein T01_5819 [Trichinella spiralis]
MQTNVCQLKFYIDKRKCFLEFQPKLFDSMLPTFFRKSRERRDRKPPTFTMNTDNVMESSIGNYLIVVD